MNKLLDKILRVIPRDGIEARLIYRAFHTVAPVELDAVLARLVAQGRIRRSLSRYYRAQDRMAHDDEGLPFGMQKCRECHQILPLFRFGQHRSGTVWGICLHCHGQKISAGNKRYHKQTAVVADGSS